METPQKHPKGIPESNPPPSGRVAIHASRRWCALLLAALLAWEYLPERDAYGRSWSPFAGDSLVEAEMPTVTCLHSGVRQQAGHLGMEDPDGQYR